MGNNRAQRLMGIANRRQFARIPVALPVTGLAPQFQEMGFRGIVRSIGMSGMLVEFPVEVLPGSILRVTIRTALGPLEVEGRVVWTAATRGIIRHGLAFTRPRKPQFTKGLGDEGSRWP